MHSTFLQIDLEWRELLVKYPNTKLYILIGGHRTHEISLSDLETHSLKYFEKFKNNFHSRYLNIDYNAQLDFFQNGPAKLIIKHEDCVFIKFGLYDLRMRKEDHFNGTKTEIPILTETQISWTDFYEQIKKEKFNFGVYLETFDLIIYLIGKVKYAVYLYELISSSQLTNKTNLNKLDFQEIQKSFPEYLLHDSRDKLANKLKDEFKTEKGKNIRLMIEALQSNNPQLINIEARQRKAIYEAIKVYFNRNIGSYQSIISPKLSDLESNPDFKAIKERLNFILKQL